MKSIVTILLVLFTIQSYARKGLSIMPEYDFSSTASEPYTSVNLLSQLQSFTSTSSSEENPFQTLNISLGLIYRFKTQ
jgi:hypothetical protein